MTEYDRGYVEGLRQAYRVCSSYAFEHLQYEGTAERAVGASSVAHVIRIQVAEAERKTKEKSNER